jgi:hypothetical protein
MGPAAPPLQQSLSWAQVCSEVRQPGWQVPAGQPRLEQHSLDAAQVELWVRHGAGWQVPAGHCSPVQQSLELWQVCPWSAQPTRGAHLLLVQVLEQHWEGESQNSSVLRQPASHFSWLHLSPEQQSWLVAHSPPGSGLQAQVLGLFPNRSPQPKEQHSSCEPQEAPTCLQKMRG